MKKIFKIISILIIIILLVSCTGNKTTMLGRKEAEWQGYYSISYTLFTGTRKVDIYMQEAQMIDVAVLTTLGRIDVEVIGTDENGIEHSLYYGEKVPTGTSQISLNKGFYSVYLYGVRHSGGVTIKYKQKTIYSEKQER